MPRSNLIHCSELLAPCEVSSLQKKTCRLRSRRRNVTRKTRFRVRRNYADEEEGQVKAAETDAEATNDTNNDEKVNEIKEEETAQTRRQEERGYRVTKRRQLQPLPMSWNRTNKTKKRVKETIIRMEPELNDDEKDKQFVLNVSINMNRIVHCGTESAQKDIQSDELESDNQECENEESKQGCAVRESTLNREDNDGDKDSKRRKKELTTKSKNDENNRVRHRQNSRKRSTSYEMLVFGEQPLAKRRDMTLRIVEAEGLNLFLNVLNGNKGKDNQDMLIELVQKAYAWK